MDNLQLDRNFFIYKIKNYESYNLWFERKISG